MQVFRKFSQILFQTNSKFQATGFLSNFIKAPKPTLKCLKSENLKLSCNNPSAQLNFHHKKRALSAIFATNLLSFQTCQINNLSRNMTEKRCYSTVKLANTHHIRYSCNTNKKDTSISMNIFVTSHLKVICRNFSKVLTQRDVNFKKDGLLSLEQTKLEPCLDRRNVMSSPKWDWPRYKRSKNTVGTIYDLHRHVADPEGAKQFVYALSQEERTLLYDELRKFHEDEENGDGCQKPSWDQLKKVGLHQALPFIGFGFLDNFIMIVAGEYIDATLGAAFGISTMAAAAMGNLFSDICGLGSASYVETMAARVGVRAPKLTPEQVEMSSTKWASNLGKIIGITIGCIIGMFPLLFFEDEDDEKHEHESESKEDGSNISIINTTKPEMLPEKPSKL